MEFNDLWKYHECVYWYSVHISIHPLWFCMHTWYYCPLLHLLRLRLMFNVLFRAKSSSSTFDNWPYVKTLDFIISFVCLLFFFLLHKFRTLIIKCSVYSLFCWWTFTFTLCSLPKFLSILVHIVYVKYSYRVLGKPQIH